MARYIDADNAEFRMQCCGTYHDVIAWDTVKAILHDAPSINIVRCKECRYYHNQYGDSACMLHYDFEVTADDFCSYGERRE